MLFGILPLYTALLGSVLLHDEPLRAALLVRRADRDRAGSSLAFLESVELGSADKAALGATALALAPLGAAVGGIAQKRRAGELDAVVLNGWAMLVGGLLLLPLSGLTEDWGDFVWSAESVGSIAYLAAVRLRDRLRDAHGAAASHQRAWPWRSSRCCCRSAR